LSLIRDEVTAKRHATLLAWYSANARALPWRDAPAGIRDPYRVLLSEVLLQQTQALRGAVYFTRFLEAFPTVEDLAGAPLAAVLKLWEGAGYYARARNLHRAAEMIAAHGFPVTLEGWRALPGIGRYTAGAILSLSANAAFPVVDGNVRRVLARWDGMANPSEDWLWTTAETQLEGTRPGAWNEALIELGATVCTPRNPRCGSCPVAAWCAAFQAGRVNEIPAPKARAAVTEIRAVALLVAQEDLVLLEERPKRGLLGGLHGVPLETIVTDRDDALQLLLEHYGLPQSGAWIGRVSHTMTHRQIELEVYGLKLTHQTRVSLNLREPKSVALSRLDHKVLALGLAVQDTFQAALF
jgi:A/G-specific adenine glycosylase